MSGSYQFNAYVVRDSANRRYLNAPTYTGRRASAWGKMVESHLFEDSTSAHACAYDINRRDPGSKVATVVPVTVTVTR